MDYFSQTIFNCFTGGTKFITADGIKQFKDFKDGEQTYVRDKDGVLRLATIRKYGKKKMQAVTLKNSKMTQVIKCTPDHRWILSDGSVTTALKEGDRLLGVKESTQEEIETVEDAKAFTIGFIIGDGNDTNNNAVRVRLCGEKKKYKDIFLKAGFSIAPFGKEEDLLAYKHLAMKQDFINGKGWRYMSAKHKALAFQGYYAADGAVDSNRLSTADERLILFIEECSGIAGYYISSMAKEIRDTNFKKDSILFTYHFIRKTPKNWEWKVIKIENDSHGEVDAWCVEEPVTHSFVLEKGIVTGNCCLVNLEDMLQNGTVISETMIEKPHSFYTACNIATQIIAQVASCQYGGQSISLAHLAPFVDVSRQKFRKEVKEELTSAGIDFTDEKVNEIAEKRVVKEVEHGVQTIQYQVTTLMTTNGQAPFITVFMYLDEVKDEQTKSDLALVIEEVLKQRIVGVKNEKGVYITPAFPKLVYVLDEDNVREGTPYYYLTELAAKCTAKRMVPDYVSAKVMKELKQGDVYSPMGK